jgi:hypothetical protein
VAEKKKNIKYYITKEGFIYESYITGIKNTVRGKLPLHPHQAITYP